MQGMNNGWPLWSMVNSLAILLTGGILAWKLRRLRIELAELAETLRAQAPPVAIGEAFVRAEFVSLHQDLTDLRLRLDMQDEQMTRIREDLEGRARQE